MERLLGCKYPPGLRFHPTDEELFMFYLKRKVLGKSLGPPMLAEVDVYRFAPWDLPAMSCLKTRDLSWYFLCPRAKKYSNGGRTNRATEWGYWKSTGNDRTVKYASRPVGKIKTLIFHRGKAPKGERTDWVMHEYKLEDQLLNDKGVSQDSYVICKIYEKRGLGPRNGEDYGAHFVEEEWDDEFDELVDGQERDSGVVLHDTRCGCAGDSPDGSASVLTAASLVDTPIVAAATNVGSPCATSASVGSPYNIAGYVGTAFVTATPVGMPDVTPAPVDMPIVTPASVGSASTLSAPSASVGFASPLIAPSASVGFASPLSAPSASMGFASPLSAPSASVGFASLLSAPSASVGFASPLSAPSASVGFASPLSAPSASVDCASPLSAPSASVGSASSLSAPSASVGCASTLSAPSASVASAVDATAMIEDDMDWLLNQFIEEDVGDFFNDLGDLADHSNQNIDWDDCFIEMKDLLD